MSKGISLGIALLLAISAAIGGSSAAGATLSSLSSLSSAKRTTSTNGSILTVSQTQGITAGEKIKVTGQHFDETVGIYLAMCKIVSTGQLPTPCGGGIDKTGASGSSIWISSNPPPYGIGLAKPFLPGGRFSFTLKLSPKIGKLDCRKINCAIYIRADHTRGDDRSYDMKVPLKFSK